MTSKDAADRTADGALRRFVLVTGLSGSGKSVAAAAFEDLGFYCMDNLPVTLLRQLLREPDFHVGQNRPIAVVADVRSPGFAEAVPEVLGEMDRDRLDPVIIYLDAAEDVLVRRYSETRRSHPMGEGQRPVLDGIRAERHLLAPWRAAADLILDTTDWSLHDMRGALFSKFGSGEVSGPMEVSILSFGFKHGPPVGADLMMDVRFLDNPYFIPGLREKTGRDAEVVDFLSAQEDYRQLLEHLTDLLSFLLPRYVRENRRYLTFAIGCTGGRHRSVAAAESLTRHLTEAGWAVRLSHRDIKR
ncbi:MAG: RNase adapter RapZ [Acidobacteriota bacterium]